MTRRMPKQKPGQSFQTYATPRDFLEAVKKKFGVKSWAWDLAANKSNAVTGGRPSIHFGRAYFGPDQIEPYDRDSLSALCDWTKLRGDLWLNPPYADIAPWAAKCKASVGLKWNRDFTRAVPPVDRERRIFFLVPAAVGSNWWANYVHEQALVVFPRPRLSFDGKNSYPKDVACCIYGEKPGYSIWLWKECKR